MAKKNQLEEIVQKQLKHISRLTDIGIALSSEQDIDKVFELILQEAVSFTNADGATIYMISTDKKFLNFEIVYNSSLEINMGGLKNPIAWDPIPLYDESGLKSTTCLVAHVYHNKVIEALEDVYEQDLFDFSGTRKNDLQNNYRTKSVIAIPFLNHENEVIGVIQLINAMDEKGKIVSFKEEHCLFLKSMASQAAITLSNKYLILNLENLIFQFIKAIGSGLDRKSKYTGNHIKRVAELTEMISQKIDKIEDGHYSEVKFSKDQLKEISIAAWMHDIGKMITPEYILDKATKLEMINDKVDLIEMRFRLAITILEKEYIEAKYVSNYFKGIDIKSKIDKLEDDLYFIKKINYGNIFVSDEMKQRVDEISQQSFEYEDETFQLLEDDERYYLKTTWGTLTQEEFQLMKEHVEITWEMLSQLTFPKKYENIALYAAAHHEKLNGKGYPKGLSDGDIPLQARILTIADIFEALTSVDRPYKKAITLSETLKIMAEMVKRHELDKNLFTFFLDNNIYLDYAKNNMNFEQLDKVDLEVIKKIFSGE